MLFKNRWSPRKGTLCIPRKRLKQARQLLMSLAIGGCLWGQGATASASYVFTNPSSGNTVTFDENGYTSNNTPTMSPFAGNDIVITGAGDDVSNNNLTINGGTYEGVIVHSVTGTADNNTITFNGGTASSITIGGSAGTSRNNTIIMNGGTVDDIRSTALYDSYSGNTVTINGGTVGFVTGNTVNINGGTISGYSGATSTTETGYVWTDCGEINIYNSPNLTGAGLAGGFTSGSTVTSGTLNIHTKNLTAQYIVGFKNINFYLPPTITNGDTVLTLTNGATDLGDTSIRAGVEGNAHLSTGDTITLIKNTNGIYTDETTTYGTLSEGVSLDYDLTVEKADDTSIVARVGSVSNKNEGSRFEGSSGLKEQTDILPTTPDASASLVIDGTDRLLDWLPPEDPVPSENASEQKKDADKTAKADSSNDFQIFANMGLSNLRTKTGSNSYTDSHNGGFDVGAARTLENRHGKLVFAPVVDYGSGSYDSYSNSGMHGRGNTKYWAVGMIARQMNYNGFYYEASLRGGRTMMDFASDDFMQGAMPTSVTYDSSAPCFAGHIRIGRLMQFGPSNQLHLYGIYSHNHQNGMSARLSTGETYDFSSVDSGRLRIGGRLTWQKSRTQKFYSGIAYQYDFSSGATGSYRGYSTSSSSIHGSSAMIELGWQVKPTERSPWMIDIGATGWAGHRKGFSIQAKLMKSF